MTLTEVQKKKVKYKYNIVSEIEYSKIYIDLNDFK